MVVIVLEHHFSSLDLIRRQTDEEKNKYVVVN